MELFLQFGYGMKSLTLELAKKWKDISVILSPRDITPEQLRKWNKDFIKNNVKTYFDPQCYFPNSKLNNLNQYDYWDKDLDVHIDNDELVDQIIENIKKYNDMVNTEAYILPCILHQYNDEWEEKFISQINRIVGYAKKIMCDKKIYATLAFPKNLLIQKELMLEDVIGDILEIDVDGFYIIAEAFERKYLIDNPTWLSNVLHICAVLKENGKNVIFGYGNHQMLPLSLMKVDAMASGTWLNVRSFTNRFIDSDDQKRKSTWVYYPKALSEYKLSFMDWAYNNNVLNSMRLDDEVFSNEWISKLFRAEILPSSTGFNETDAFKHYLCCLRHQVTLLNKDSYKKTLLSYEMMLNTAEREIERLEKNNVYAQNRSFRDVIDVNKAAITQLDKGHGFNLNMLWNKM